MNTSSHASTPDSRLTSFYRGGDAMAYLEDAGIAHTFNTGEGHCIMCYDDDGSVATIYEYPNSVEIEYLKPEENVEKGEDTETVDAGEGDPDEYDDDDPHI